MIGRNSAVSSGVTAYALDPAKATASEIAGEKLFFGKAQCSTCHPAPFYLDITWELS
jgi:cytochrome c peroxidase